MIQAFVITADHELSRLRNLEQLHSRLPGLKRMEAVYPAKTKVPFLRMLQQRSKERTGWRMNEGEIGVLLSNRKIWHTIAASNEPDEQMFLVLESDSCILDNNMLQELFPKLQGESDLFFWGGWSGHIRLERSSKKRYNKKYSLGRPYIRTVYGAYGYSLNKKAARYLLKQTSKISHPVDQYKFFIQPGKIRIGAVTPEVITHLNEGSTIGHPAMPAWRKKMLFWILDCKNAIICFFR